MKFGQRIFQRGVCVDKIPSSKLCLLFYESMDDGCASAKRVSEFSTTLETRRPSQNFKGNFPTGPTQILDAILGILEHRFQKHFRKKIAHSMLKCATREVRILDTTYPIGSGALSCFNIECA